MTPGERAQQGPEPWLTVFLLHFQGLSYNSAACVRMETVLSGTQFPHMQNEEAGWGLLQALSCPKLVSFRDQQATGPQLCFILSQPPAQLETEARP